LCKDESVPFKQECERCLFVFTTSETNFWPVGRRLGSRIRGERAPDGRLYIEWDTALDYHGDFYGRCETSISAINVSTVTVVAGLTSYCNSK